MLTVREFQTVKRGNREQKEIVEVRITPKQLLERKKAMTVEFTKHQWDKKWDLHNRRLLFETFPAQTLVIQTDFSATTSID